MQTKSQYMNSLKPFMPFNRDALGRLLDVADSAGDTDALCEAIVELDPPRDGMDCMLSPEELVRMRAGECVLRFGHKP
jgi:hypothetical protein